MRTPRPLKHRRPWTPGDDAQLFMLAKENTPASQIALQLERTPESIYDRAQALRIPLSPSRRRRLRGRLGAFALSQPVNLGRRSG